MTKTTNIYGLYDPRRPRVVMYVGKGLSGRAASHWRHFLNNSTAVNKLLRAWFQQMKAANAEPRWRIVEVVPVSRWEERERRWIAAWRKRNPRLCNVTRGGNAWPHEAGLIGARRAQELYPGSPRHRRWSSKGGRRTHKRHPNLAREWGRKYGPKGGRRTHELHPNLYSETMRRTQKLYRGTPRQRRWSSKGGRRVHKLHPNLAKENGRRATRWSQLHPNQARENGRRIHEIHPNIGRSLGRWVQRWVRLYPKQASENGRNAGRIGGRIGGTKACHLRWHVRRGVYQPSCRLCREAPEGGVKILIRKS